MTNATATATTAYYAKTTLIQYGNTFEALTDFQCAVAGSPTIAEILPEVHPLESVITTECVPFAKFVGSSTVEPLDQAKLYGGVPPDGAKSILPSLPPLQLTSVYVNGAINGEAGSEIVTIADVVLQSPLSTLT